MYCNLCGVVFSPIDVLIKHCIRTGYGFQHAYKGDCVARDDGQSRVTRRSTRRTTWSIGRMCPVYRVVPTQRQLFAQTYTQLWFDVVSSQPKPRRRHHVHQPRRTPQKPVPVAMNLPLW